MKKVILIFTVLSISFFSSLSFAQQATHLVIAEIFGGGGNTGAPYLNDYVVLYNPTASAVPLTGMSLQYNTALSTDTWDKVDLTGSMPAFSYYLVQFSSAGANGVALPFNPDLTSSFFVAATIGKVAIVNSTIALITDPTLPDINIIDFVGYGTTASVFEGTGRATAPSNTTSIRRKDNSGGSTYGSNGSGWDSNNNNTDFYPQPGLNLIPNYPLASTPLANHIVLAEVYGAGGLTGATYINDYVVLYNPATFGLDISTWSLQYADATGTTWTVINLNGTIPPNTYYLIQLGSGGSNGSALPTPNLTNSTDINEANGKVALVNTQTALTGSNPLTSRSDLVDFIGYGASADAYEGAGQSSSPGTSSSIRRKDNSGNSTYGTSGSGWDSNNNNTDFYIETNLVTNPPIGQSFLANQVVIAEIYGGGGNSTGVYLYDYVVLYNPTASSVDVSTWSLQRASATGSNWVTPGSGLGDPIVILTGSILPNSYYLIEGNSQGAVGVPLPVTANVIDHDYNLGRFAGKVALVNDQNAISGIGDVNVVDFVGYGTATSYEGFSPAPTPGNTKSIRRKNNLGINNYGVSGSGWDSDNNNADFYVETDILTNAPLPVELSSFSAILKQNAVQLNWRTATEVNNYGFNIERKRSDDSWNTLGFVEGHGNSNSPKDYSFLDYDIAGAGQYYYRLKQVDNDGSYDYSQIIKVDFNSPLSFDLKQNYPNPFNPSTTISFNLPNNEYVSLKVFNIIGEEVRSLFDGELEGGIHSYIFNAEGLSSGFYIYKLSINNFYQTKKMLLLK